MKFKAPQALRHWAKATIAAGLLTLAACSSGPNDTPAPATPSSEPVAVDPDPQPVTPTGEEKNRVAILVPLSGDNAAIGRSIANAAQMALIDTEESSIRLTLYDTAASGGAEAAANQALADGNRLFLGPLRGENVGIVGPIADRADVPVIAYSNDESVAGDNVYIMGFMPTQSIDRVVDYADSQGADVFAGIAPNGLYGQRTTQAFLRAVEREGGRVARLETYDRSPDSVTAAARRIAAVEDVDMILVADSGRIAQIAAPSLQLSGDLIGTELWASDSDLGRVAGMRGSVFAAVPERMFGQFAGRYRSRFDTSPYRLASLGYDSMLLAVRLARQWDVGDTFPEGALTDPGGFQGVDGIFRFGRDGIAERSLEVRRVTASGTEVVSPASTSFGD
ncbi:penicillin-binding protein activator [Sphingomicrobium sp. XHP0235]|uniref:penicillin-binding protein activator n=1 Tax=Sphingomicrobium aquimarinum TaxID=3133971 RepID=UPI0031FE68C8